MIEKAAVKIGGGVNHRIGLFDMILLKDNHIDFAGGIEKAITRAKEYLKEKGKDLKIEIEVRNMDELEEVMRIGGIDLLQVICRHVAGLRALVREPAHKHGHGRNLDRLAAVSKVPQHAHDDRRYEQQADARDHDRFDTLFLMQGSHRPFCRLTGCRRGYN